MISITNFHDKIRQRISNNSEMVKMVGYYYPDHWETLELIGIKIG